jgi:PIN domain nuclease of toxin-antitoxin system
MNLLLDTHTLLWHALDDPHLSANARTLIADADNELFLSIASLWELAIKESTGKLNLQQSFADFIARETIFYRIKTLDIKVPNTVLVAKLPLHHRDPFGRMLVAHAFLDRLPIVSADKIFDAYGVTRLW